jgi:hypothetical protein
MVVYTREVVDIMSTELRWKIDPKHLIKTKEQSPSFPESP